MLSWIKSLFTHTQTSLSKEEANKLFYQYLKKGNAQKMRPLLLFLDVENWSKEDLIHLGETLHTTWDWNAHMYSKRKTKHHQAFINELVMFIPKEFHEEFLGLAFEHDSLMFVKAFAPFVQKMDKIYVEYQVSTQFFKAKRYPLFLEYMADKFLPEDVGVWGLMHDVPALYDYSLEKVSPQALREHMISQENSIPYDQLANSFTYQRFLQQYTKKERDNIAQQLGKRENRETVRKM